MKKMLFIFTIIMSFMLLVQAEEILTNDQVILSDEEISTDLVDKFDYNINDKFEVDKEVNGSGIYLGQDININNNISGIGLFVSGRVNVTGNLEYGIIFGKEVLINSLVSRDLFVATTDFKLNKSAVVDRDLFVFSNITTIEGNITRDVYIGSSRVVIKSGTTIGGDVRIGANSITIEDGVIIAGVLKYNESANIKINDDNQYNIVTYKGEFIGNDNEKTHDVILYIYKTIGFILLFILINWIFPKLFNKFKKLYDRPISYLANMGIGLGVLIVVPLLSLFLMILPYTLFIGLISLAFYFIFMYFTYVLVGYLLGEFLKEKFFSKKTNIILSTILGIFIVNALCFLPFVNLLVIILGLGSIFILIGTKGN